MRNSLWKKTLGLTLVSSLAAFGCGGDDDSSGTPDAAQGTPDASTGTPDAAVQPVNNRFGRLAVTDVTLTADLDGPVAVASGASVIMGYSDISMAGAPPAVGTCVANVFQIGGTPPPPPPPPSVDEGLITVVGSAHNSFGCQFDGTAMRYVCAGQNGDGVLAEGDALVDNLNGTFNLTIAGVDLTANVATFNPVGSLVRLTGFPQGLKNAYVVAVNAADGNTIVTVAPTAAGDLVAEAIPAGGGTYTWLVGEAPVPTQAGGFDFLVGDGPQVSISKAAGGAVEAVAQTDILAAGNGFVLDDASTKPWAMPVGDTANPVSFSCDGTNGNCGFNPTDASTDAILVFISSTDAAVSPQDPFAFPQGPGDTIAEAICSFVIIGGNTPTIEIPAAEWAKVVNLGGSTPAATRVRTSIVRVSNQIAANADGGNASFMLSGEGHLGFTDVVIPE